MGVKTLADMFGKGFGNSIAKPKKCAKKRKCSRKRK
jgi:hypothetical protein